MAIDTSFILDTDIAENSAISKMESISSSTNLESGLSFSSSNLSNKRKEADASLLEPDKATTSRKKRKKCALSENTKVEYGVVDEDDAGLSLGVSYILERSYESRNTFPLIPSFVYNIRSYFGQCVLNSVFCLLCSRFPSLLNFISFPIEDDEYFSRMILQSWLLRSILANVVTDTMDISNFIGSLQILNPTVFLPSCRREQLYFLLYFQGDH